MSKKVDIITPKIDTPELNFNDIEEMKKVEHEQLMIDEEEFEEVKFDLDQDEFDKGLKKGSYFAGILASMLTIGVPAELAVDVLINEETIAFNKSVRSKIDKENIIDEEMNRM